MNQTAVEWLIEQIEAHKIEIIYSDKIDSIKCLPSIVAQAKEMEKEQHGETWDAALIHVDKRGGVILRALVDFDEYWEKYQKV
jgi:hypothetical protein